MKKILFSLIAVLGLFSACSNDDIEVTATNATTISVETKSAYDAFGSTKSITEMLLASGKDYSLGVFTYIYDDQGNLAASKKDYMNNFNTVTNEFKLPFGDYTVITVQVVVDKKTYEMESYKMVGEDKLNTLEIKLKENGAKVYWYESVGVDYKQITVSEKSVAPVELVNMPIGTLVECEFFNFDKSNGDFDTGLFVTKERAIGRYLSPKYTGNARFEWDELNQENNWYIRGYAFERPMLTASEAFDIYMLECGKINYNISPSHSVEEDGKYYFGKWTSYPSSDATFTSTDGSHWYAGCYYLGKTSPRCAAGIFSTWDEYKAWYNSVK